MTKLLVDKVLHQGDLVGLADMLKDHAKVLGEIWARAGLLGGPIQEAQQALSAAGDKLEMLAKLLDQHAKDAKVVSL